MPGAVKQIGTRAQSGGAVTLNPSFPGSLTTGGLCVMAYGGRSTLASVADDQSQTWTRRIQQLCGGGGTSAIEVWTAPATAAGTAPTLTVTKAGGADFMGCLLFELESVDTSTPIDVSGSAESGSSSPTGSATTSGNAAANGQLSVFFGFADGGVTWSAPGGTYTLIDEFNNPLDVIATYLTVGSTSGAAFNGTNALGSPEFWGAAAIVFKDAVGGGGGGLTIQDHYYRQMRRRQAFARRGHIYVPTAYAQAA